MSPAVHLTVALLSHAACGAGDRTSPRPPASRPGDLAEASPACDDETLRGFDPGLDGLERVAIEARPAAPRPGDRREWPCERAESDENCRARVRGRAGAASPASAIESIDLDGEPAGWAVTLEVDGHPRTLNVADEHASAEVRRLRAAGHQVTMIEGHVRFRAAGRRAVVRYATPLTHRRWVAELRWPKPVDPLAAVTRLQDEVARADLMLERYQLDDDTLTAVVVCP